jgi:[ribosomal protein S18]-alanine N-acetyltransferase
MTVHVRWMIRNDMNAVLAIERRVFEYGWGEPEFIRMLRQQNCVGMVAERDETVLGYMLYTLKKRSLYLENFAVDPDHHRNGIGTALIDKLKLKLSFNNRVSINTLVRETNLNAQLFFRAMRFRATGIESKPYEDTPEDGYNFLFSVLKESPELQSQDAVNF